MRPCGCCCFLPATLPAHRAVKRRASARLPITWWEVTGCMWKDMMGGPPPRGCRLRVISHTPPTMPLAWFAFAPRHGTGGPYPTAPHAPHGMHTLPRHAPLRTTWRRYAHYTPTHHTPRAALHYTPPRTPQPSPRVLGLPFISMRTLNHTLRVTADALAYPSVATLG